MGDGSDQHLYGNAALQDWLPDATERREHSLPFEQQLGGSARYNLESNATGVNISVPIYTHPADADDSVLERWSNGIDYAWNDQFELERNGDKFPIEFHPEFTRDRTSDATAIGATRGHSEMRRWLTEDRHGRTTESALRDPDSVETTAGHEFGHLIGNPDEYGHSRDDLNEITGRTRDWAEGTTERGSGMGTSGDPMLPRHLQMIADWIETRDPDGGTPTITAKYPGECYDSGL